MTNEETRQKKPKRRLSPKILVAMVAYLCVLGVAIRVDGVVEAQAQYKALITEAETFHDANLSAVETARQESLQIQQLNAQTLSVVQSDAQALREEEAEAAKAAAAAPAKKPGATATVASATPATGTFNAAAYGAGKSGKDKLSYWMGVNNDTIGYLRMPGTNISYAVLQNSNDINYYTAKGYDKQYSYYGVLWTNPDTRSAGSSADMSSNTVIYGHNWTNYSGNPRIGGGNDIMFAQLTAYHHLSMAQSYPYFYYSTAQEEMTFKIFACFYTEPSFNYIQTEGNTQAIVDEALRRSRHDFHTDVGGSDKIITLSTCTRAYGATNNQRFVVMGRLLRPGESVSAGNITNNPNHKQPSVW